MAGLIASDQMAKALWPGIKAMADAGYFNCFDGIPPVATWDRKGRLSTYATSPLFGIFRIWRLA